MAEADPIFLGYRVKKVIPRPEWLTDQRVIDICSVSDCMSEPPANWIERWDFNAAGCYSTLEIAISTIPVADLLAYSAFAYFFYPVEIDDVGCANPKSALDLFNADPEEFPSDPPPMNFVEIGFDVVNGPPAQPATGPITRSVSSFSCSPLSCNNLSREYNVNEHCLLKGYQDAVAAAQRFAASGAEPPPYYIVRVHRCDRPLNY